jgi:hypothetical protein
MEHKMSVQEKPGSDIILQSSPDYSGNTEATTVVRRFASQ